MIKKKDGFQGERQVVMPPALVELEERDALTSSLFITDIGYYPQAEHHYRVRKEGINQYVLIYCVDGSGFYEMEGQRYEVKKNQYFILPAGRPHAYGATPGHCWTIYWLHFRGAHAPIYAEHACTPQDINVTRYSRISDRLNIFEEILNTLYCGENLVDLRYASSLLHYFLASMRYLDPFRRAKTTPVSQPSTGAIGPGVVEQAIHYMRENIERRISMADVLHYVGYSASHFTALFRRETGQSPLAYFNRLKVEKACCMLRETQLRINQICYKVGFEDALYFSRLFTRVMGLSPTAYRQTSSSLHLPKRGEGERGGGRDKSLPPGASVGRGSGV